MLGGSTKIKRVATWIYFCALSLSTLLVTAGNNSFAAEPVSFSGKTVTMLIGYAPGGGTDIAGRLIAQYIGKYLPGNPHIITQNMPGADGLTAMNYFAQQVKPDGMTMAMGSGSVADPHNFRKPQAQYDPTKYAFIGGTGRGGSMLIISKEAEKRLYDKNAPPVMMGSPGGAPRSGVQIAAWGIEFLGWNAKWVAGYRGTNDLFVALERGEVDMTASSNMHQIEKLLATGKFKVLLQSGALKDLQVRPRSELPEVPLLTEMVAGKIPDETAAKSFEYWTTLHSEDKWLALPPGVAPEIVQAYRNAFARMVKDEEFLARAKSMAEDFSPAYYPDLQLWMKKLGEIPPESIDFLAAMLRRQGV